MSRRKVYQPGHIPPPAGTVSPTNAIITRYTELKSLVGLEHPDTLALMLAWNELLNCFDLSGGVVSLRPSYWPALVTVGFIPGVLDLLARTVELNHRGVSSNPRHAPAW